MQPCTREAFLRAKMRHLELQFFFVVACSGAALVSAQLVLNATRASMHGFERGVFWLDLLVWKRFEALAKTALRSLVGAPRNAHLLCTQAHFATAPRDLLCTP